MGKTDFETTDLFRDQELPADPYPFYEWVREQGPVWYYPLWDVWLVTGYEEVDRRCTTTRQTWSNCNTVSGPVLPDVGPARGRRHHRHHRGAPRRAAVQRPAALVRPAQAHRAPRPAHAAHHAEAAQGERGVHVAARRPDDRRVHRPRRVRAHPGLRDPVHAAGDRRPARRARRGPRGVPRANLVHKVRPASGWSTSRSGSSTSSSPRYIEDRRREPARRRHDRDGARDVPRRHAARGRRRHADRGQPVLRRRRDHGPAHHACACGPSATTPSSSSGCATTTTSSARSSRRCCAPRRR